MTRPLFKHPNGWEIANLEANLAGEVIIKVGSGNTPPTDTPEFWGCKILWLTPKEITEGKTYRYISTTERTITENGLYRAGELWEANTVMLTKRAPVGAVTINKVPMATNQGFLNFRCGRKLLPEFLYYWFKANGPYLDAVANGSTYQELYPDDLFEFEIALPPIVEQQTIISTLGTFDDKIELNTQINRTIEEMAAAIFKSWFVDFKPFRGGEFEYNKELGKKIPKGWAVGKVADLCKKITNGGTPRRMEPRFWDDGTIPWFKTGELLDGVLLDSEEKITQEGLENSSCHLLPINTVVVALYASPTVGRLGLLKVPATTNQACSALEAKDEIGYAYVFHVLMANQEYLNNIAVGSAQQNISQTIVKDLLTPIPPTTVTKKFQQLVEPLYDQMTNNSIESHTLAAIRDVLLPKLLSGEIRVGAKT